MLVITGVVGVSVEARHVYAIDRGFGVCPGGGKPCRPRDRALPPAFKNRDDPGAVLPSEAEAIDWLGQYTSED